MKKDVKQVVDKLLTEKGFEVFGKKPSPEMTKWAIKGLAKALDKYTVDEILSAWVNPMSDVVIKDVKSMFGPEYQFDAYNAEYVMSIIGGE